MNNCDGKFFKRDCNEQGTVFVIVLCSVCEQSSHFAYDINKAINLDIICYGKLVQMCKGQHSICVKIKDTGT